MKVAVIGAGSTYTPELVQGFLDRADSFPQTELWLMDILEDRLQVVGGFAQRIAQACESPIAIHRTTNRQQALSNADYVITQFRVGWLEARRKDEYLGRRYNLIGQETTGVGGMAKALRTIPVMLDLAQDIQTWAPNAFLINFTNPSGLIMEALSRYAPQQKALGLCNGPIYTQMTIKAMVAETMGRDIALEQTQLDAIGLNHLSWYRGFTLDGDDVWDQVLRLYLEKLKKDPVAIWDQSTIQALGMIPNSYLQYFYYTHRKLQEQKSWPPSRAEQVMRVEADLLRMYADPDCTEIPAELMQRGGAYYSTIATQVIDSHFNDREHIYTVNVPNSGAVAAWPSDWVLEIPCAIGAKDIRPLPAEPLPEVCQGLLAQIKMYERLSVEAAVEGDRRKAFQAMLAHPLGPSADQVQIVLDDLLETHQEYLPRFWA